MMISNEELRLKIRQEKLDREYKESVERASRCSTSRLWSWTFSEPKSESIFDNTARTMPVNLYLDCKEWERGERWHKLGDEYVESYNELFVMSFMYHTLTKALPLWLFIMIYF